MTIGLCPGSFDPFTYGHLDLVRQALAFCDRVVIGIAQNPKKQYALTWSERRQCAQQTLEDAGLAQHCEIALIEGLLATYCRKNGVDVIVKGLRNCQDFAYEQPMARINQDLAQVGTVFLPCRPELSHISSSAVKELITLGAPVDNMVSPTTAQLLEQYLRHEQ